MAFIFGRRETMGRWWLRVRPRSFWDWENKQGVLPPELCDQHKHKEGTPMLCAKRRLAMREILKEVRVRGSEVRLTYKLPMAMRTPLSKGKTSQKEEFLTLCNLVETARQCKEPVCTLSFRLP